MPYNQFQLPSGYESVEGQVVEEPIIEGQFRELPNEPPVTEPYTEPILSSKKPRRPPTEEEKLAAKRALELERLKTEKEIESTQRLRQKEGKEYDYWKSKAAFDKRDRTRKEVGVYASGLEHLITVPGGKKKLVEHRDLYLPSQSASETAYFGGEAKRGLQEATTIKGGTIMRSLTSLGQGPNPGLNLVSPPTRNMNTYNLSALRQAGMPKGLSRLEQVIFSNLQENQGSHTKPSLVEEIVTQGYSKGQTNSAINNLVRQGVATEENNPQEEPIVSLVRR
jgi:hypothetical protein